MENKLRKRLTIDRDLNEVVKQMAKDRKISSDILIENAIRFFITYEQKEIKNDNIYTQRINQLTQEIELMRHENAALTQAILNRLDTIVEFQNTTDYL
ncbi:hypothetical protein [Staphylococcus simulans]|uniref:hypothetical protein n=1 Tax=Staphylococcus simulans TaxID=1286 RepID=UPI000D1D75D2|nr:hypothetical protein [Staphylococcus simulans]PTJ36454.1 hypothetical protein BU024_10345 [Staphylococcus simulans]